MSRVLITGVRGFVGRAVAASLMADGHAVSGTSRDPAAALAGATLHAVGDLGQTVDWAPLLEGVETIVHLAGQAHAAADEATHMRVNADASRQLAEAASVAGVRRLVFLSTVKVHGEETVPGKPFTEADDPRPEDAYGRSKWEAEQAMAAAGLETVILRPPLVYGPGVRANFAALLRLCDSGLPLPFATVANRRSLLYLGNLVDAIRLALGRDDAAGGTFLISDGEPVSTPDLVRAIAAGLGRPARLFPMPPALLQAAATLIGHGPAAARLTRDLDVDDSLIRDRLGWRPPFSMTDGLAATMAAREKP